MKKLLLLLITLTTLTNVNYASFPVRENLKTEVIQDFEEQTEGAITYAVLSVLSAIIAIVSTFLFLGNGFAHNGNPFPFLLLTLASIGSTIFSAIQARKKGASWGKAVLGLGIIILGVLLIMVLIA